MQKRLLVISLFVCLMIITGCVSIPHEQLSRTIETQELSAHVHFLAQPALKGRKPRTWESATARRYLKDRFETYGLLPWGQAKGYEQSFGFGTNVIGVLPGSDPNLADEIVILSAHYDHLGKRKKGIYHGASDNASGVAVLLEIAERFSLAEQKPKRSVCFAAFDCEEHMLLGSFVFTCRPDFDKADIAAVVNVDILGRDFLDVLENTVCVVGTEKHPKLRQQIIQTGDDLGIDVAVLGADFVGPRGDHVPFETMAVPCLFFTCGHHSDYHMPSDVADRLNYNKIKRSANVIFTTVGYLTNAEAIEQPITLKSGDTRELKALKSCLAQISENYEKAELTEQQGKQIAQLYAGADELLRQDNYSLQNRRRFMWKASNVFGPLMEDPASPRKPADSNEAKIFGKYRMAAFAAFYADHRMALIEGARKFVRHLVKYKPSLFSGMPKFEHELYELNDDEISLVLQENGKYLLAVLPARIKFKAERSGWLFKHGEFSMFIFFQGADCEGTREQIIDFCLLQLAGNPQDKAYCRAWQKVLTKVTGAKHGQTHNEWMQWRMENSGSKNEEEWVLALMRSDNPDLAAAAISNAKKIAGQEAEHIICEVIKDNRVRVDVRAKAISTLAKDSPLEEMLAMVDVLDNDTQCYRKENCRFLDKSYPFYDHPGVRLMSEMMENWYAEKGKSITLGDEAERKLKELTKKDFGKDGKAWRKWIEANIK